MKYLQIIFLVSTSLFASAQTLETYAGSGNDGYLDGPSEEARFAGVEQMTVDQQGNLYVVDALNHSIRKIDTKGAVTTFAGTGLAGDVIGPRETAQFNTPLGITVDSTGNFYVVDNGNFKIKVIRPNGMVELLSGTGEAGYLDGPIDTAIFGFQAHICIDKFNNLYTASDQDHRIRKIDLTNMMVSTFAGASEGGFQDGTGSEARFLRPQGLAIDHNDNLYVGDRDNNAIRKITPDAVVTTLAGNGEAGDMNGVAGEAQFNEPKGLSVDVKGNVYVADRLNFIVRKIDTTGMVSTIAGLSGGSGYLDGEYSVGNLIGRAVDVQVFPGGFLMISDWHNEVIRKLSLDAFTAIKDQDLNKNNTIKIHPNPSSDYLNIAGKINGDFELALLNENGQVLLLQKNARAINIKSFHPGIYFLQISGKSFFNVEKIIIK